MSSIRLIILPLLLALFFANCEDKKKPSEAKEKTELEKKPTAASKKDTLSVNNSEEKPKYPQLTNENVVEFLTQYGKENPETEVKLATRFGDIYIELFKDAPLHRANFIYLIKQKYFDNTLIHRVVPNFIIQGGNSDHVSTPKKRRVLGKDYLLPSEASNGRIHTYGTVSGAKEYRENPDKRTAPFEFFIFLGKQQHTSHLNGDYTVFGKVTRGMEVVEKIANLPSDDGEWPKQNVYITAEIIR